MVTNLTDCQRTESLVSLSKVYLHHLKERGPRELVCTPLAKTLAHIFMHAFMMETWSWHKPTRQIYCLTMNLPL